MSDQQQQQPATEADIRDIVFIDRAISNAA